MQQDQDIKGFTILELLVVIAIVAIISGVAYPNFSKWKEKYEINGETKKVYFDLAFGLAFGFSSSDSSSESDSESDSDSDRSTPKS